MLNKLVKFDVKEFYFVQNWQFAIPGIFLDSAKYKKYFLDSVLI